MNIIQNARYVLRTQILDVEALSIFMPHNHVVIVEIKIKKAYIGCQFI